MRLSPPPPADSTCCNSSECAYYFKFFVLLFCQQTKGNGLSGTDTFGYPIFCLATKSACFSGPWTEIYYSPAVFTKCFLAEKQNNSENKNEEELVRRKARVSQAGFCTLLFLWALQRGVLWLVYSKINLQIAASTLSPSHFIFPSKKCTCSSLLPCNFYTPGYKPSSKGFTAPGGEITLIAHISRV